MSINDNLPQLVRQPYQLTANFIKFNFRTGENRVLVRILQRLKVHQEINYSPQIDIEGNIALQYHWKDLILESDNAKERLDKTLISLREKTLKVDTVMDINGEKHEAVKAIGIIEKPVWNKSRSHVKIKLDHKLYEFLTDLSKGYTEFLAEGGFILSGAYNIKFYYWVNNWYKSSGRKIHTLDQFRKELEIPADVYKTNTASAFRKKIIDPAKKVLDEIADVSFNYSVIKSGRQITGFNFAFYKTNNKVALKHSIEKIQEIFTLLEPNFSLSKEDRSRLVGMMNKYQFTVLKTIINTHFFDIQKNYERNPDVCNSINKVIIDHYDHLFEKKS